MKKYTIYLGILAIGLLLGWILFGNSSNVEIEPNHNQTVKVDHKWTCSMHPQIMQPEAGDCPICGMDLIPAASSADGLLADQFKLTENAMALANIQTSIVGNNNSKNNTIKLSGKIAENEESNAVQVSYFSGRIEQLEVNFTGEVIRKGQLLATIYSPELYAAQQELISALSLKETQPELYKAVRGKLKLWKLSEKQINQIETSGKVLENFAIYATVSGTVTKKMVDKGDYVKQGQVLFKLAKLNTVWANFDVYENQIKFFKKGQKVSITTNAYPSKKHFAKISFIDPVINTKTRTLSVRVVLDNIKNNFKPGMFVEGKIDRVQNDTKQVLSIPATSVLWTGERSVIYLKPNPNESVFEMKEVTLGDRIGENYEILKGLNLGDVIVTNGVFTIDAAAQLQGKKSMMNKSGGKVTTGHEGHLGVENKSTEIKLDHSKMNKRIKVSSKFQKQLKSVYKNYIELKDALIIGNSNNVKTATIKIEGSLTKVDMRLLSDKKAHDHWMSLAKEIKSSTNSITSKTKIDEQRNHFKHLSSHLTTAIELFGINQKVFSQFCPMADKNKGGYWLSNEEKVLNPYFGKKMLTCGSVKKIIE